MDPNKSSSSFDLRLWGVTVVALVLSFFLLQAQSHAGIYSMTQFVEKNDWSLALEPEVTLTSGAGFATSVKYTRGLNDISNMQFGLGTGSGARQFRMGGAYTFDFIPDLEGQIGVGVGLQAYYFRVSAEGSGPISRLDLGPVPYLHKSFEVDGGRVINPYLSVPFGLAFLNGRYLGTTQVITGVALKTTEHVAYNVELGINARNTDSYISGGFTYFH